jgi:hypothetical protein
LEHFKKHQAITGKNGPETANSTDDHDRPQHKIDLRRGPKADRPSISQYHFCKRFRSDHTNAECQRKHSQTQTPRDGAFGFVFVCCIPFQATACVRFLHEVGGCSVR